MNPVVTLVALALVGLVGLGLLLAWDRHVKPLRVLDDQPARPGSDEQWAIWRDELRHDIEEQP